MRKLIRIASFALLAGLAAGLTTVSAHQGATGVVKERMDMMKSLADAMKEMGAMFKGEKKYDAGKVGSNATLLKSHAEKMTGMFPAGSDGHPSEAKPTVWSDSDGFASEVAKMGEAADALAAAAADQSAASAAFKNVGASCSSCHQAYREKK